ncbi:MAG: amidohydrolase family protein, partial [Bradyrhizobium sp.]|uniref:amidohydrolase n=1 Tax=Bradyrhizobium sp. TaxID=376 RepID=UPI001D34606E
MTRSSDENKRDANASEISRRGVMALTAAAGATAALGPPAMAQTGAANARPADLVLINGRIHTMDNASTVTDAVAIRNGRFVAIGADAAAMAATAARTVNLGGKTAFPGIIEPHCHVVSVYNRPGYHTILENTANLAEVQKALAERRKTVPADGWITSMGGFHPNQWSDIKVLPTREQLDQAVPDRPVFLYTRFTGPAVTNSMGKKLFDEWDKTPAHPDIVPVAVAEDGLIKDGGFGKVTPATSALFLLRSRTTFDDKLRTTMETQRYAARLGLTTMGDKVLFPTPGPLHPIQVLSNLDQYRMYDPLLEIDRQGKSISRIEISFLHHQGFIPALGDMANQLPELRARLRNQFPNFGSEMVSTGGIGEWAAPVNVDRSTPGGQVWFEAQRLVAEAGWRNENAVSNAKEFEGVVQAWEELAAKGYDIKDKRYIIHHADGATPELLARAKALGAGVAMAAFRWVVSNDGKPAGVPFRTILDSGVRAGLQGDGVHISPLNPWAHMQYVITGLNSLGQQVNDGQRLNRAETIRLFTRENAWFLLRGSEIGTIEAGKRADVAVLDRDYFTVPDQEIRNIRSAMTVVGGN